MWLFLNHATHVGFIIEPKYRYAVVREFAPTAAIVLAFLLMFGLAGGWILAGSMLAPLTRIAHATGPGKATWNGLLAALGQELGKNRGGHSDCGAAS